MTQYITNLTKRWIFAVLDVQLRRYNRFYKRHFYIYFMFFIFLYAEIKRLQHSVTYHGRVTVRLIFY